MTADGKKTAAVVLAAGSGKRVGTSVHKQSLLIRDKPVIYYTLRAFELSEVDEIVLVTGADEIDYCSREIVEKYDFKKVRAVIAGGKERYDSVYEGLKALKDCDYVLIHDGARPLISSALINANISCVQEKEACITAVPAKDTIKTADDQGYVADTPDRSRLWQVQTPQTFSYNLVLEAYRKREEVGDGTVTDDAMVVEKYADHSIYLLKGDYCNIKITTPEDLIIAEAFLNDGNDNESVIGKSSIRKI